MDEDLDFNVEILLSEIIKELKIPVIVSNKGKENDDESEK
jgi:hypothetical protein